MFQHQFQMMRQGDSREEGDGAEREAGRAEQESKGGVCYAICIQL